MVKIHKSEQLAGKQLAFKNKFWYEIIKMSQFSSVTQSCPTLCNPMDCSTPGFPVHHQLPELAQILSIESVMPSNHVILCCPLILLPYPPAFNLSQHQSLFQWMSSHQMAKVLEFQFQHVLPMNTQDWSSLGWTGLISSRIFSNTTFQKHQFFNSAFIIVQL